MTGLGQKGLLSPQGHDSHLRGGGPYVGFNVQLGTDDSASSHGALLGNIWVSQRMAKIFG